MSGDKQTRAYRKRAGAIARLGGLACGLLLLAGLVGAVPLAGQVTPPSAAVPGDWTWMSGSDTLGSSNQGVSGVYGSVGAFGSGYFPGGRWGTPSWIDNNGNLWLFGGFGFAGNGYFGYLNDLWEFSLSTTSLYTNDWAYMGGGNSLKNNYCAESPTYGTQGVFAAGNVPGGRQSAASWIDKSGNLWLFGGDGVGAGTLNACGAYSVGYLNDLWEFNLSTASTSTPEWAWMRGSSTPNASGVYVTSSGTPVPGAREYASAWTDSNGNFWLFGGFGYDANGDFGYLNDLWEFSPTLNQWTWIDGSSTVPTYSGQPGNYGPLGSFGGAYFPGGRYGASTWTDSSGNFWLFGGLGIDGSGNSGNLNDLWEFNPTPSEATTNYWAWMGGTSTEGASAVYGTMGTPATTNTPGGSFEASSWVDNSGNFWLFGGGSDLNALWAFNLPTRQWVWMGGSNTGNQPGSYSTSPQMPLATNIPGGRNQTTSWTDTYGNFWLFGGDGHVASTSVVGALNDLWVYPPPAICWGPPSAIQISTATLPVGFPGESYFQNFAATGGCEAGYVWSITTGATTLTNLGLSFSTGGDLSGSPNAPGSYPFTVKVTDPLGDSNSQNYTLTIYPDISVLPTSLPAGTMGTPYSQTFTASGGSGGPYTFSVASGTALSAVGLTLSPGGLIAGTPGATETAASLTIQVADSLGDFTQLNYSLTVNASTSTPAQVTDNETITVTDTETFPNVADAETITVTDIDTVRAYTAIAITPSAASFNAGAGAGYATYAYAPVTFTATGGTGTLTLTESGALPTGITFAYVPLSGTWVLSGTPATSSIGTYPFSVTATDADGDSVTVQGYSLTIQAASAFPAVVTDDETITVTDTETFPNVADAETITVTDIDTVRAFNAIAITPSAASFNAGAGAGDATYAYAPVTFTATGGTGTLMLTETGALPSGITFSNGVLSGTPATSSAGSSYPFSITATDAFGDSLTLNGYTLTIQAASAFPAVVTDNETISVTDAETFPDVVDSESITVTDTETVKTGPIITGPASLPAGQVGVTYTATTFTASDGVPPYTWTAAGLPAGLSMSTGGELSGTPTVAGVFPVTVTVQDSAGNTNSVIFSLTVASPSLGISASPDTLTIVQGQSGQTTITFTPVGGYSGPVTLSCSGLPANTLCAFTLDGTPINSYTFPGNNQQVMVLLTIQTDVSSMSARTESAPTPLRPGVILAAIAFWCPGSLLGLMALRRKRKLFTKNPRGFRLCLFVLLVGTLAGLAGCISGGGFGAYVTPAGTSTVTVVVMPGSGSAQTLNIGVTITQQ